MRKEKVVIPIYFGELVLIQVKKLSSLNKKYNMDLKECHAACVFDIVTKKGKLQYVVAFEKKTDDSIIDHERIHLINKIFIDRQIKLDLVNDEPQAYLMGWLFKECKKFLDKKWCKRYRWVTIYIK